MTATFNRTFIGAFSLRACDEPPEEATIVSVEDFVRDNVEDDAEEVLNVLRELGERMQAGDPTPVGIGGGAFVWYEAIPLSDQDLAEHLAAMIKGAATGARAEALRQDTAADPLGR